jgi:hypothetical protein
LTQRPVITAVLTYKVDLTSRRGSAGVRSATGLARSPLVEIVFDHERLRTSS